MFDGAHLRSRSIFTAEAWLRRTYREAKSGAWDKFLENLDRNPWGRPYTMMQSKLRQQAPPTESFESALLSAIVSGLFPAEVPEMPLMIIHLCLRNQSSQWNHTRLQIRS